jgi:hypothetical protein
MIAIPPPIRGLDAGRARFLSCGEVRAVSFGTPARQPRLLRALGAPKQRHRIFDCLSAFCDVLSRVSVPTPERLELLFVLPVHTALSLELEYRLNARKARSVPDIAARPRTAPAKPI